MNKEEKEVVILQFRTHEGDTGSVPIQVAILTRRINYLTEHLKLHRHDYHTQRGLLMLVGQRRRLLNYLKREDAAQYQALTAELGIRK